MPRLHRWEQPLDEESLPAAGGQDSQETAAGSQQQASNTQLGKKRSWASSQAEGHGNAVQQPEGAEEAGAALGDLLLELHVSGRLTAKHACLISHYAQLYVLLGNHELRRAIALLKIQYIGRYDNCRL